MPEPEFDRLLAILYEYRESDLTRFEAMQSTLRLMHEMLGKMMLALEAHGGRVSAIEEIIYARSRIH